MSRTSIAVAAVLSFVMSLSASPALAQNPAPAVKPAPAPAAVPMVEKPAAKPAAPAEKGVMVGEPDPSAKQSPPNEESGLAAVYNDKLNGRTTASGKRYDRNALTAAHKTLPFGTKVRVTNTKNKRSVVLVINDRGPFHAGRILDISPRAAGVLGIHPRGMGDVTMVVVRR